MTKSSTSSHYLHQNFQWVQGEKGEIISREFQNSVFLGFYRKGSEGCIASVKNEAFSDAILKQVIAQVTKYFGSDLKEVQIKVIVQNTLASDVMRLLHREGLKVQSCTKRSDPKFRIVYYPESGRLRIQKEEALPLPIHQVEQENPMRKTRLLIVDDSATIRKLLTSIFSNLPDFEVVAAAELPSQVEGMIQKYNPDVITMDIHMPEMDGVTLLKILWPKYSIPTVMITSVTQEEGLLVLNALEAGAIDYIQKPTLQELPQLTPVLIEKVRMASQVNKKVPLSQNHTSPSAQILTGDLNQDSVIAIGSSTGGTEALKDLLTCLPEGIPPVVIVQHIPPVFSDALARRLDDLCPFEVKEAQNGDVLLPGRVLIAPGGKQMRIVKNGVKFEVEVKLEAPVNRHMPSVDVLFDSVAALLGKRAIGIILTGMGGDGAAGLLKMRKQGARTIAQDEASCVVFGMPREAIRLGAAMEVVPLQGIANQLMLWLSKEKKVA